MLVLNIKVFGWQVKIGLFVVIVLLLFFLGGG